MFGKSAVTVTLPVFVLLLLVAIDCWHGKHTFAQTAAPDRRADSLEQTDDKGRLIPRPRKIRKDKKDAQPERLDLVSPEQTEDVPTPGNGEVLSGEVKTDQPQADPGPDKPDFPTPGPAWPPLRGGVGDQGHGPQFRGPPPAPPARPPQWTPPAPRQWPPPRPPRPGFAWVLVGQGSITWRGQRSYGSTMTYEVSGPPEQLPIGRQTPVLKAQLRGSARTSYDNGLPTIVQFQGYRSAPFRFSVTRVWVQPGGKHTSHIRPQTFAVSGSYVTLRWLEVKAVPGKKR